MGCGSPGGFRTANSAGSKVILVTKAMIQRAADLDRRAVQGSAQLGIIVTLRTVPYVELNSEIDA
jgi:hypothetical protein